MHAQDVKTANDYYAFGAVMPGRSWNNDTYKDTCMTCGQLKHVLDSLYSYQLTTKLTVNTTSLTTALNSYFHYSKSWADWQSAIFSTCQLWDSTVLIQASTSTRQARVGYAYNSAHTIGTSNFTVEGWVWLDNAPGSPEATIAAKYHVNPSSGEIGGFRLYVNSARQVVFKVGNALTTPSGTGREATLTTTGTISYGQWVHILALKSTNLRSGWRIYINGSNQSVTGTGVTTLPTGTLEQGSLDGMLIGGDPTGATAHNWHGRLRQVRLYLSGISPTNATAMYNSGCPTSSPVITAVFNAPLTGCTACGTGSMKTREIAQGLDGTITTSSGGTLDWEAFWRDTTNCKVSRGTSVFCRQELVKRGIAYRFAFNGMEKDDEWSVEGGSYDFGARIYDARVGRFLAIDPKFSLAPHFSPFSFARNSPIINVDSKGEEAVAYIDSKDGKLYITTTYMYVKGGDEGFTDEQVAAMKAATDEFYKQATGMKVTMGGKEYEIGAITVKYVEGLGTFAETAKKVKDDNVYGVNTLSKKDSRNFAARAGDETTLGLSKAGKASKKQSDNTGDVVNETTLKASLFDGTVNKETQGYNNVLANSIADEAGHTMGTRHPGQADEEYTYGAMEKGELTSTDADGKLKLNTQDVQNMVNSKEVKLVDAPK